RIGDATGAPTPLVEAVAEVNRRRIAMVSSRVERAIGSIESAAIALLGLTYKPGTDTLRRSQSLEVAADLQARGASVRGHDPMLRPERSAEVGFPVCGDPYEAAAGADALVVMTPCPWYVSLVLTMLQASMLMTYGVAWG